MILYVISPNKLSLERPSDPTIATQDEELHGLTQYSYLSAFGTYREEADAAIALPFA